MEMTEVRLAEKLASRQAPRPAEPALPPEQWMDTSKESSPPSGSVLGRGICDVGISRCWRCWLQPSVIRGEAMPGDCRFLAAASSHVARPGQANCTQHSGHAACAARLAQLRFASQLPSCAVHIHPDALCVGSVRLGGGGVKDVSTASPRRAMPCAQGSSVMDVASISRPGSLCRLSSPTWPARLLGVNGTPHCRWVGTRRRTVRPWRRQFIYIGRATYSRNLGHRALGTPPYQSQSMQRVQLSQSMTG